MDSPMAMESPKEMYPMFSIGVEHLPEAKKWRIGETYHVLLEVKQTGISMHKTEGEKDRGHVSFDITGIETQKAPKKDYRELPDKDA